MTSESADRIRVLVVDDHDVVRRGLLAYLGTEPDLDVVGASESGEAALELLRKLDEEGRLPDVVIMDLLMTPLDGVEATRRIHARYDGVAVVALTSYSESDRVHAALAAGASGYVLKTAPAEEVVAAVRAARRGDPHLGPEAIHGLIAELRAPRRPEQVPPLTVRELDVLRLVALGQPNKVIASRLGITERTARTHVSNILRRLGFNSRTEAAVWAVEEGIADASSSERPSPGRRSGRRTRDE
jgi:DNA-binding NarL/FixJ family response regulator